MKHITRTLFVIGVILLFTMNLQLGAEIYKLVLDGPIDTISEEYIVTTFEDLRSNHQGIDLVVIQLDTPGGFDTSMRSIIKAILNSPVPVAVYVFPRGARAASAGFFITISADIAAMAPETNMGSASPVAISGAKIEETMKNKITNDAVSYIKSLARSRGRNIDLAAKAVSESASYTATECLEEGLIETIAEDFADLIEAWHGKTITLVDGSSKTLDLKDKAVTTITMTWRQKFLRTITNPNIAYFLLIFGLIGLYLEFSHPGAIIPGVLGGISLLLAFLAFQILPINYVGLLLILLSIGFFIAEIKVQGFGILGVGGIMAFILGSVILINAPIPEMRPNMTLVLSIAIPLILIVFFLTYKVFKAMKRGAETGREGLIGKFGTSKSEINRQGGKVFVHGEWWNAVSDNIIPANTKVVIESMDEFKIKVRQTGG